MIFHVSRNGEVIGEYSRDDFIAKIFAREILSDDYYWIEGMTDWAPVASYRVVAATQRIVTDDTTPPMQQ